MKGIEHFGHRCSCWLKGWNYSFWCVFTSTNLGITHKQQDAASIWQDFVLILVAGRSAVIHHIHNIYNRSHTVWSLHLVYWTDLNLSSTQLALQWNIFEAPWMIKFNSHWVKIASKNYICLIIKYTTPIGEALGPKEPGWTSKGRGLVPWAIFWCRSYRISFVWSWVQWWGSFTRAWMISRRRPLWGVLTSMTDEVQSICLKMESVKFRSESAHHLQLMDCPHTHPHTQTPTCPRTHQRSMWAL